jgi:hypothetical protein
MAGMVGLTHDQRLLGIALGQRALLICENARVLEFPYPDSVAPDDAVALGNALADFLQARGIIARRAVIGVPAKWLIAKPYLMPPTDSATAASVLWLHAADAVPDELGPMIFDSAGHSSPTQSTHLLLLGLQQRWMDWLLALCKGARLKPVAVAPTATSIGAATATHSHRSLILWLHSEGIELIHQDGPETRSLRHVGIPGNLTAVFAELRRTSAASSASVDSLVLWDDIGHDADFLATLRQSVNLPLVEANPRWVSVPADFHNGLSVCALTSSAPAGVNFLRPKLAPPKENRPRRRLLWLTAAAAMILLTVALALADMARLQREIASIDHQLDSLRPAVEAARKFVSSTQFAATFQPKSPRALACVRDLILALGQDQQTCFSSFNLRSDMTGQIVGQTNDGQNVVNLVDQLNSSGHFSEINCKLDPSSRNKQDNEVSFSLTFSYIPQT